jgi:hypothetical protein
VVMASGHPGDSDSWRGPRLTRRAVLMGAAGGLVGLIGGAVVWDAVEDHGPLPAGSVFAVKAAAGLPLLLDPNRGDRLNVILPLASQGGVPSTVLLPIADSARGTDVAGPGWVRTVRFRQPYTGQAVDPRWAGVIGRLPRWGVGGAGSADVVVVRSRDGWSWSAERAARQPRTGLRSVLEDAPLSPAGSIDPMALPEPILVWAAADMAAVSADGVTLYPGQQVGTDFSGSGNDLLVNPGAVVTLHHAGGVPRQLPSSVSVTARSSGLGCAFAGGPTASWTAIVGLLPGGGTAAATTGQQPVFALRPVGAVPSSAPRAGTANATLDGGDEVDTDQSPSTWVGPVTFLPAGGPTVVGSTSKGSTFSAMATAGGTVIQTTIQATPPSLSTTASKAFGGIDLISGDRMFAVVVFAAALSEQEMEAAAARIAYVGRLTRSEKRD